MKISEFRNLIKEEIQAALYEEMTHNPGAILKPSVFNNRPTLTLTLDADAYQKVANQFDDKGNPIGNKVKDINYNNTVWTLYSQKIPYADKSKIAYRIYGVAGDYTFGGAPSFYQSKYSGNKKAAMFVFNKFIKDFNL
jgi:hypothetical protein